jgi:hypothetical protein
MKTFGAQITQINAKLGDIASGQENRDGAAAEETRVKSVSGFSLDNVQMLTKQT